MKQSDYSDKKVVETAGLFLPCVRRFMGNEPVLFVEGRGAILKDAKGKEYIDLLASHGCATLIGYNHPAVVEAIKEQVGKLYSVSVEFPTQPVIALAEKLPFKRVFFANAGTEAVETALFLAKKYTGKYEIVSLYGDFHGRSHGSRSILGYAPLKKGMGPMLPGVARIPAYYCYRCTLGLTYPACGLQCAKMLEDALLYDTSGDVAVFVTESFQGTAGNIPAPDGYFQEIKKILDKHKILLYIDEIFTAFGNTGKKFCFEHYGVVPDMTSMSKTLGGGLPISALLTTEEVAQAFAPPEPAQYFTTFGGNPLMAAAALAVVETIMKEKPWEKAAALGAYWMKGLKKLQNKYELIGDVRGKGVMIGVELVKNRKTKEPAKAESLKLKEEAVKRGLILPAGQGWLGNTIRMVPPVVMTQDQIDQALHIMDQSFATFC
ncbi:MAG: aspartate aminotransferase family protein [Deltaproteobacteria bacterium]|nr:aspartate aminotransferase family protein [Deltaproteobacteria bacterium]